MSRIILRVLTKYILSIIIIHLFNNQLPLLWQQKQESILQDSENLLIMKHCCKKHYSFTKNIDYEITSDKKVNPIEFLSLSNLKCINTIGIRQ